MAPQSNRTDFMAHVSIIYRIYFLYFEPFAALGGTYLTFLDPERFLSGTIPVPALTAAPIPMTPALEMMMRNLGMMYALFAIQEGIVLRLTRERSVVFAVIISMIITDIGHLYAAYAICPEQMFNPLAWNGDEWINYGTLFGGLFLRLAFMAGIGRK